MLKVPFELVIGKSFRVWRCPVKDVDTESMFLIKLVNWSEDVSVSPNGGPLLDEPNYYFEARTLIVTEQRLVERELDDKHNKSSNQPGMPGARTSRKRR